MTADVGELVRADELLEFVTAQRWYGSKARDATGLHLLDYAALREGLVVALADVQFSSGAHEVYQLLIAIEEGGAPEYDALREGSSAVELIHRVRSGGTLQAREGTVEFRTLGAIPQGDTLREVRPLGLEQSNTSVVLDDELIVKAYRRVEAGVNPELELLAFLTQHEFRNVADLYGWWGYSGPLMDATLGIVQRYLDQAVDGWTLALREIRDDPETFVARLHRLGSVVGGMHAVLASDADDPAFCPETPSTETLALITATIDEEIGSVFAHLPDDDDRLEAIAGRGDEIRDRLRGLAQFGTLGRFIRHHGDLHLAQALWCEDDWKLVDFEGEPARSLPERRRKRSPLRDVAGMLRSFGYAASSADAGSQFEERARSEFLTAYLEAVEGTRILPDSDEAIGRLITIFELEKAVYELRYELNNRPDWVHVPVRGILRLLEEAP